MEILKAFRLSFDRTTPNTAAATPSAIKYGTATSSNSATFLPMFNELRGYRFLKGEPAFHHQRLGHIPLQALYGMVLPV
jgi:hypothetical protein